MPTMGCGSLVGGVEASNVSAKRRIIIRFGIVRYYSFKTTGKQANSPFENVANWLGFVARGDENAILCLGH